MKKIISFITLTVVFASYNMIAGISSEPSSKVASGNTNIIHITSSEQFKKELKNSIVLVDFYADWCPPCKMLAPTIEKIANTYDGKVKIIKVNVEKNEQLSREYKITGIPDVRIYKDSKEIIKLVGMRNEEAYKTELDKLISGKNN